jgi:GntR family transcriptional regulator
MVVGPLTFDLPKYAQIVNAVQDRITLGVYPVGSAIPSEAQLQVEFGASRPVVVRALGILQQDGWLDSEQGRGRFVRAGRAGRKATRDRTGWGLLVEEGPVSVRVLSVAVVACPTRIAGAGGLGVAEGTPVLARRRLVSSKIGPIELGVTYIPTDLAAGTDVAQGKPLSGGVLNHVKARKGVAADHASERIGARPATAEESRLLEINRRESVLTVLVTAFDKTGTALMVVDAVVPASRRELEDTFPIG